MSDADTLRLAAVMLRNRAKWATSGYWADGRDQHWPKGYTRKGTDVRHVPSGDLIFKCAYPGDARYIAMFSPPVALTLADWLDATAKAGDRQAIDGKWWLPLSEREPALAVARACLGASDHELDSTAEAMRGAS